MQKGLLNALDKGECQKIGGSTFITDFRLISATNEDLESKVKENKFRKDLYYRITAYPLIILPPLRERLSDIPVLLDFFISQKVKELKVAPEVLEAMHRLYWPGNIRELEKKVNFAISNCLSEKRKILTLNDFPGIRETGKRCFLEGAAADKTFEQAEIEYFQNLLNKYPKNIAEVARRAGLKRTTCISKLKKLGLLKNKPEELDVKD
jgi:transcriptional regulator with GAF, ATPase, and Fis domain